VPGVVMDVVVGPVRNDIKLFFIVSDEKTKKAGAFFHGMPFQSSLILASKADSGLTCK
jgi:hypothetical protein